MKNLKNNTSSLVSVLSITPILPIHESERRRARLRLLWGIGLSTMTGHYTLNFTQIHPVVRSH